MDHECINIYYYVRQGVPTGLIVALLLEYNQLHLRESSPKVSQIFTCK